MTIHPKYRQARNRAFVAGWGAVGLGFLGIALPLVPGIAFIMLGFSLISLHSRTAHKWAAQFRMRHSGAARYLEHFESWLLELLDVTTHTHTYVRIPRTDGKELHAIVEISKYQTGVAILLHSARGTMEGQSQNALAELFRAQGYTVVRFDAFNGFGESDGDFTNLTATSMLEDLCMVVSWVEAQPWWHEHELCLVGHSLGGLVAGVYAAEHPEQVRTLLLLGPTTSGAQYRRALMGQDETAFRMWEETRLKTIHNPMTGEEHGLSFAFVIDLDLYDLVSVCDKLTMRTYVLVGTDDTISTVPDCKTLVDAIGENASLHILLNVPHIPTTRAQIRELERALCSIE